MKKKSWFNILFGTCENKFESEINESKVVPAQEIDPNPGVITCEGWSNPQIACDRQKFDIKIGDKFTAISGAHLGREFVVSDIIKYKRYHFIDYGSYMNSGQITMTDINDGLEVKIPIYNWENPSITSSNKFSADCYCSDEFLPKYKKYLEANKNFEVNFKIKKQEGSGYISIWYNTNHPDYRDWRAIKSKVNQCGIPDNIYVFEDVEDAQNIIDWFSEPNEDKRRKGLVANNGIFERRWLDV